MKYIREKFQENPLERFWFYMVCVAGISSGVFVIIRGQIPYHWLVVLGLLLYVRAAHNLLWWFGDHPEE